MFCKLLNIPSQSLSTEVVLVLFARDVVTPIIVSHVITILPSNGCWHLPDEGFE